MSVRSSALVVAHPGHELRVHGWLERAQPVVCVLTDGSGATRGSRLDSTALVLSKAGARQGSIFGRLPDRMVYEAILDQDFGLFTSLADELASQFISLGVDLVVADAVEDYNPSHDICRFVVDAAVTIAAAQRNRAIASHSFTLVGAPDADAPLSHGTPIRLRLSDEELKRKMAAAREYVEMAAEVEGALQRFGPEAFRTECLRPVDLDLSKVWQPGPAPFYERYGEQQVAAGLYDRVIRGREHIAPLALMLQTHARERSSCSLSPSS